MIECCYSLLKSPLSLSCYLLFPLSLIHSQLSNFPFLSPLPIPISLFFSFITILSISFPFFLFPSSSLSLYLYLSICLFPFTSIYHFCSFYFLYLFLTLSSSLFSLSHTLFHLCVQTLLSLFYKHTNVSCSFSLTPHTLTFLLLASPPL